MSVDYGVKKQSARERIFQLLSDLGWHSYQELHAIGGVRYSARILELKRLGYQFADEEEGEEPGEGKRYRLLTLERGAPQEKRVKAFLLEADVERLLAMPVPFTAQSALTDALESFRANRDKL